MNPTILLGIDGATFTVLDALLAQGRMPRLAEMAASGVRANLLSTPHPLTPPAWTTLATGRSPGNHGIFDFIWAERRENTVYFTLNDFRNVRCETIWSMVSRQGGRIATLNFPFMSPAPELHGVVIPGLVSWKHLRRSVRPGSFYETLRGLAGFNAKELAWDFSREKQATELVPPEQQADWVEFHIRRERQWFNIFRHVVRHEPADLMAVLLDGVDKIQHVCWRFLDPAEPHEGLSPREQQVRQLCLQFFEELDAFIGDVVDSAPMGCRIFVASDHGFGPTRKVFRVNAWLHEQGYLSWSPTEGISDEERRKIEKLANGHFVHLDWEHTTAYAQSSATNGIHIRVQREPGDGGVPASQYERFRAELVDRLLSIVDPETGARVVSNVLLKDATFPGRHNDAAPDLTLVLFDYGFISTRNKLPILWARPETVGTHNPAGVFIGWGPGLIRGRALADQSILDVAATLLFSLGLPIPEDLESRVIEAAFTSEFKSANPIRRGAPTVAPSATAACTVERDREEEGVILERLRALGYVE